MSDTHSKTNEQRIALVTGATGFVGSHLAQRLVQEGWQVHILIRANSKIFDAAEFSQITTHIHDGSTAGMISCMTNAKPDVVFHLASLVLSQHQAGDVETLIQSNLLMGTQLLEAMQVNGVKYIVNTGTSWQHYHNEDYNPVCLYAATKQAFEVLLEYYVQACGVEAITLKLFDTYGADDPRPKLFHLLNKSAESGVPLDMSAGEQLIDLVHVDDVVSAYLVAAQRLLAGQVTTHERYAVSSGQPLPLKKLVELYADVCQKPVQINWGARPYRNREVMVPWDAGLAPPSWKMTYSLAGGLMSLRGKVV